MSPDLRYHHSERQMILPQIVSGPSCQVPGSSVSLWQTVGLFVGVSLVARVVEEMHGAPASSRGPSGGGGC